MAFREVFIFIFLITAFHLLWRVWANVFFYRVFGYEFLGPVFAFLTGTLRESSAWVCNHILHIKTEISGAMLVHNYYHRIGVTAGCSGLKQYYQFFFLMALYPGPWVKKTWFIPLGIILIFLVNIFRIVVLFIVIIYNAELFSLVHDWVLRPMFFVVMFLLWVWWIEKLAVDTRVAINKVG